LKNQKGPVETFRITGGFSGIGTSIKEEKTGANPTTGNTKHQTETKHPKNDRTKGDVHQVFHDNVTNIFSPGKTGLNHGKTCLHKENQKSCQAGPENVGLIPKCCQRICFLGCCRINHKTES